MMEHLQNIPNTIAQQPNWAAIVVAANLVLEQIRLEKLLIYYVDEQPEEVLRELAFEFNVEGLRGWDFQDTIEKKRELIKYAIQLHRFKGTKWAIEQAIIQAGYTQFSIEERVGSSPVNGWDVFRLKVDIEDYYPDLTTIERVVRLVNLYKRQSAVFEGITFDSLIMTDDLGSLSDSDVSVYAEVLTDDEITTIIPFRYNGVYRYNGARNYSQDSDVIEINIV